MRWLAILVLLAVPAFVCAADIKEAKEFTMKAAYQESLDCLAKFKPDEKDYNEYCYLKAINHYSLNQQREAEQWADRIVLSFSHQEMPRRYYELCKLMKYDMETWEKKSDDLSDISRDMKVITDRLKNGKGGKETQQKQKEVLDRIGKMIKDKEDAMAQAQKDKEDKEKKEAEARARARGELPDRGVDPQQDTQGGTEKGTGQIDRKRVREIAEVWGKLPEKERAKCMVELTRALPPKDRAIIEAYLRELQKRSTKK